MQGVAKAGCAGHQRGRPVPQPRIIPYAQWQSEPPTGYAADAARRNKRQGDSLVFYNFTVTVLSTSVDSSGAKPVDVVRLRLARNARESEELLAREGAAINWRGFNLAVVHAPKAVVAAASSDDVVAAVSVANELDVTVRVLGHGHGVAQPIEDGIVITTKRMGSVVVDPGERTARITAGATWGDVLAVTSPHGLAPLCGSAPHVGVIGYLLGGGIGPVARTYGFAADHVRSLDIVTADGGLVRADVHFNQDLFWAARGGKSGLGVVVAVTIDLFPLTRVYGGGLYFSADDSPTIFRAFGAWARDLPEQMTASIALLRLPPAPDLPERLRGRFVAHLRIAYVGPAEAAEELLTPIRAIATPIIDTIGELPYSDLGTIHSDPVHAMPVIDAGALLDDFDATAADSLLAVVGPHVVVPLAAVEIRRLGGALARPAQHENAVGGRDAAYSLHVVSAPVPELFESVIPAVLKATLDSVADRGRGQTQINFVGAGNGVVGVAAAWSDEVAERLDQVRRRHEPAGRFPL